MPAEMSSCGDLLQQLCAPVKLERDKAQAELEKIDFHECDIVAIHHWVIDKLDHNTQWEEMFGGLVAARVLIQHAEYDKLEALGFVQALRSRLLACHDHPEYRVRIAAGECMGALCVGGGLPVFLEFVDRVKRGIAENLEHRMDDPHALQEKMNAEDVFHDTAGWKSLETWMKCLQCLIEGLGAERFGQHRDSELLDLIFACLGHTNRFVRETGYMLLGTHAEQHGCQDESAYRRVAEHAAEGLSDNWSQVRMAASVATRQFLSQAPPTGVTQESVYALLLPPMCLNRYYVAEGVRLYSQESWRRVTGMQGKELAEQYLDHFVQHYILQTDADNHAVREAACACISEAGTKLCSERLRPHVPALLDALVVCFGDESWPVRDAACVASGALVAAFPDEALRLYPDALVTYFTGNLIDSIASVRQGAAVALAKVAAACGDGVLQSVINYAREHLEAVKDQSPDSQASGGMERGPGVYGVIHQQMTDGPDDKHTDQQMYSCGSLAPKMHKGKRGGGCHDGQFRRPSEPWEQSDGCIHLIGELAGVPSAHAAVSALLPTMVRTAGYRNYTHHVYLLESVCKIVPKLCRGLGKRPFKMHLELLMDPLGYSLTVDTALTKVAAEDAFRDLGQQLGPSIVRGRVEMYDPALAERLAGIL